MHTKARKGTVEQTWLMDFVGYVDMAMTIKIGTTTRLRWRNYSSYHLHITPRLITPGRDIVHEHREAVTHTGPS